MKPNIENPCTWCDGDGWYEEPTSVGERDLIHYTRYSCERCRGSGEEPEPANEEDEEN